jgi:hypothetical protein
MARRARSSRESGARAEQVKDLVNESMALQVELLGAAVQVWSTLFESLADYTKTASEALTSLASEGDANAALDRVTAAAREKLAKITKLPEEIGKSFSENVRRRAGRPVRARAKR